MSTDADDTGRKDPPISGTELEMLNAFLDYHRATLLWKVRGVGEEDLLRKPVPTSKLSLAGLVKHLAYVERFYFQLRFQGADVSTAWTSEDPDADFRLVEGETPEGIIQFYEQECETSRRIVVDASLDDLAAKPSRKGTHVSLRWLMYHMIEETARHNGHADLLREAIDGVTGE